MKGKINGKGFEAAEFFFDGCHKIYLADSADGYEAMKKAGWDDEEVYPIEELPAVWVATCPLRFVLSADLKRSYVNQFEPAEFDGWELDQQLVEELELLRREQVAANEKGC